MTSTMSSLLAKRWMFLVLGALIGLGAGQLGDPQLEFRDEAGRVRARIGLLDAGDDAFGMRLFGRAGEVDVEVSSSKRGQTVQLGADGGGRVSVQVGVQGIEVVVGDKDGWHWVLDQRSSGLTRSAYRKGGAQESRSTMLALELDPVTSGRSLLRLYGESGAAIGIGAEREGALLQLVRDEKPSVRLASEKGAGDYLLLGPRGNGLTASYTEKSGASILGLSREGREVTVRNGPDGAGLGVTGADGSGVWLGVDESGQIVDRQKKKDE